MTNIWMFYMTGVSPRQKNNHFLLAQNRTQKEMCLLRMLTQCPRLHRRDNKSSCSSIPWNSDPISHLGKPQPFCSKAVKKMQFRKELFQRFVPYKQQEILSLIPSPTPDFSWVQPHLKEGLQKFSKKSSHLSFGEEKLTVCPWKISYNFHHNQKKVTCHQYT